MDIEDIEEKFKAKEKRRREQAMAWFHEYEEEFKAIEERRREQAMAWLHEYNYPTLDYPSHPSTSFDEDHPIAAKSKRDQERADQAFRAAVEDYRKRHRAKYEDIAGTLGVSDATLRRSYVSWQVSPWTN